MGDRTAAIDFYNAAVKAASDNSNPEHLKLSYQLHASAAMADPTWADAIYQCGNINSDLGKLPAAIACWRRGIEIEPEKMLKARLLCNMGWRLHNTGKIEEGIAALEAGVALDPNLHLGWVSLSCAYQSLNRRADMVRTARLGYSLQPNDPLAEMQLAFALLFDRQFKDGFNHLEIRFKYKLQSYLQFPYAKWKGEPDKTVYLVADQGLGDTLSFARFVPALCKQAKYVHAVIQPELLRLFQNMFVGIANLNLMPAPASFPPADAWTTFVSLPFNLKLTEEQIRQADNETLPAVFAPKKWKLK